MLIIYKGKQIIINCSRFCIGIGHSFLADSAGWPAMCQVFPKTAVHFPPCIPPKPAYTTLLIRRFGCLPLSFRFLAPDVT